MRSVHVGPGGHHPSDGSPQGHPSRTLHGISYCSPLVAFTMAPSSTGSPQLVNNCVRQRASPCLLYRLPCSPTFLIAPYFLSRACHAPSPEKVPSLPSPTLLSEAPMTTGLETHVPHVALVQRCPPGRRGLLIPSFPTFRVCPTSTSSMERRLPFRFGHFPYSRWLHGAPRGPNRASPSRLVGCPGFPFRLSTPTGSP